jgi:hypothetical protein
LQSGSAGSAAGFLPSRFFRRPESGEATPRLLKSARESAWESVREQQCVEVLLLCLRCVKILREGVVRVRVATGRVV